MKRFILPLLMLTIVTPSFAIAPFHKKTGHKRAPELFTRSRPRKAYYENGFSYPHSTGTYRLIVLLVQYPNLAFSVTTTKSAFASYLFETNRTPLPSLADYYRTVSYSNLTVTGEVYGIYTTSKNYGYYGQNDSTYRELIEEALTNFEAEETVDLSSFDNNDDNFIDAVVVIHAGPGNEMDPGAGFVHSHVWVLENEKTLANDTGGDTAKAWQYALFAEIGDTYITPNVTTTGIWTHELLHTFNMPDLYDTTGASDGVGDFCLMASGCYLYTNRSDGYGSSPSDICSYLKYRLGWLSFLELTNQDTLQPLGTYEATGEVYRTPANKTDEFFLIENRRKTGMNVAFPGEGILIWHVDTEQFDALLANNQVNAQKAHKAVDVEEASGTQDLDTTGDNNAGDENDFWQAQFIGFSATSTPSSHWYGDTTSGVSISGISEAGETMYMMTRTTIGISALAYPSPFSYETDTAMTFTINATNAYIRGAQADEIEIIVYTLAGARVTTLSDIGSDYTVTWDGRDANGNTLSKGVYLFSVRVGFQSAYSGRFLIR